MRALLALALTVAVQLAPRDTPAVAPQPATGTGIIKGRVVAADTGSPVRRAAVTVGARGVPARTIYTDAAGRYEARNLVPGSYFVSVSPSSYQGQYLPWVPPPLMPDGSVRRVPLAAGQTIEWYDLTLPRAGAIVGRIVDEQGDPVSGISVFAVKAGDPATRFSGANQPSDEFGRYRMYRLAPGEYEIVARPFERGETVQGVTLGFMETYFPGTPSREEARRVRVRNGQETTAADLPLVVGRMLRVRGTVMAAEGGSAPMHAMVSLAKQGGSVGTSLDAQGRFSFQPQPPGRYQLIARLPSENREATYEYTSVPLVLTDADADGAVLTMKPTVTVSGRVIFDGAPPAIRADTLRVRAEMRDRNLYSQLMISPAVVGEDLTFTLHHLAGDLLLRPSGTPLGAWSLKAVLLGSEDITDVPHEFRQEDSGRVQVVLTSRWSALSGSVTAENGEPASDGTVLLFTEDKTAWFAESSRMRAARVGRDGRYLLPGLRPGRYYVVALPPSVTWDFQQIDLAVLERFAAGAIAVTLGEDERRPVDVRVTAAVPR